MELNRMTVRTMSLVLLLAVTFFLASAMLCPHRANAALSANSQQIAVGSITLKPAAVPSYTVLFKPNGGKGSMSAQTIKRGKWTALKANAFSRPGYKFVDWNTKKNGSGDLFPNKQRVKNLAKSGKSITMYAQWRKATQLASGEYTAYMTGNTSRASEVSILSFTSNKIVMYGRPMRNGTAFPKSKSWTFPLSSKCRYYIRDNKVWQVGKSEIINESTLSNWGGCLHLWVKSGKVIKILGIS